MSLILRVGEQLVDEILRIVLTHGDLLDHHALFALQVVLREFRPQQKIRQQRNAALQVFVHDLCIKTGAFLGSEGVGRAAETIHLVRQRRRVLLLRALEHHVLHKVRISVFLRTFVDRAGAHKHAHGRSADIGHPLAHNAQSVAQRDQIIGHFSSFPPECFKREAEFSPRLPFLFTCA